MIARIVLGTAVGIAAVLGVSWLLYARRVDAEVARAADRTSALAGQLAETLRSDFERTALDLRLLSELGTTRAALLNPSEANLAGARMDFETFARSRPHYFQVRYLDRNGRERIRFDRNADVVSHASVLQDKSDRYYVRDLFSGPAEGVYVSPLDWNIEFGRVEKPERPTIRFGLWRGEGAVLLNADARLVLRSLREAGSAFQGRIRLVDAAGGAVLVEAAAGSWTFLPASAARSAPDDVAGAARVAFGGQTWDVEAWMDRTAPAALARSGFRDHMAVTVVVVLLLVVSGILAVRAARRTARLQSAERHAEELEAINRELRKTRELVVERTRLATVGEMFPVLAHELRNPLQAMLTAARSLRADVRTEEGHRLLDILLEEIVRLDAIARDWLPGRTREPEPCDLVALTRRVVALMRAGRVEGHAPSIDMDGNGAPLVVQAVPDSLKQVLWNVLRNACEAAGPGGRVWVRVFRDGTEAAIEVEDDGPGPGAPKPDGHGIGLSLCDELLRGIGGRLEMGISPRGGARVLIAVPADAPSGVRV